MLHLARCWKLDFPEGKHGLAVKLTFKCSSVCTTVSERTGFGTDPVTCAVFVLIKTALFTSKLGLYKHSL